MPLMVPPVRVPLVRVPHLGAEIRNKAYKVGFKKLGVMERS
jgi:hypothetical protein